MCKTCGCHVGKIENKTLTVEGMTCNHCKAAVEKAVRALPGVLAAEVDLTARTVKVDFDAAKSGLDDIRNAVDEAGYRVV